MTYGDIPLPFGEMHTVDLPKRELIRAAVVAQLAKPAVEPSALWVASRTLRYQALIWVGSVGVAITAFANLQGLLTLSEWCRALVTHWREWTYLFWHTMLSIVSIRLPREVAPSLSFMLFTISLSAGLYLRSGKYHIGEIVNYLTSMTYERKILALVLWTVSTSFGWLPCALIFWWMGVPVGYLHITSEHAFAVIVGVTVGILIGFVLPLANVLLGLKDVWFRLASAGLYFVFAIVLFVVPTERHDGVGLGMNPISGRILFVAYFLSVPTILIVVLLNPGRDLFNRLVNIAFGLLILIAFNQLSLYAPDIRALLKPPA